MERERERERKAAEEALRKKPFLFNKNPNEIKEFTPSAHADEFVPKSNPIPMIKPFEFIPVTGDVRNHLEADAYPRPKIDINEKVTIKLSSSLKNQECIHTAICLL